MPPKKARTVFVCQQCGYQTPRWLGRCPDCGTWGRLTEFVEAPPGASERAQSAAPPTGPPPVPLTEVPGIAHRIAPTGIGELDRVLGGGLVPGGVILIGGDPGIGKSTLVLQAGGALARRQLKVLYVSGEESLAQVGERGRRLGVNAPDLYLAAETSLEAVVEQIGSLKPAAVIVDSIQTVWSRSLESAAGSLSQVREVAGRLTEIAKRDEVGVWLIGHVTKEGNLAGPRALEHLVDTVVYFEGDRQHSHRILRATKNRFGPTDEIGVFEMRSDGLAPVDNPSALFLAERPVDAPGSAVAAVLNGTRTVLVEIQALVAPTGFGTPRRTALGFDQARVALLAAVLEKKVGLDILSCDLFVNVAGGLTLDDPAADLACVAALASSFRDRPLDSRTVVLGEVGLAGEVRAVAQADARLAEAARLGFARALLPAGNARHAEALPGLEIEPVASVEEALDRLQ